MEPFLGQITMFGFNFCPRGWAFCDGQLLPIASNSALFSLLGTIYGGDGRTTFALPDLRGRVPIHQGQGSGLTSRGIGTRGGEEDVLLTLSTMPSHNHVQRCNSGAGNATTPVNGVPSVDALFGSQTYNTTPNANMDSNAILHNGGNLPHNNMQPYITLNFCIALVGVYPSRN